MLSKLGDLFYDTTITLCLIAVGLVAVTLALWIILCCAWLIWAMGFAITSGTLPPSPLPK